VGSSDGTSLLMIGCSPSVGRASDWLCVGSLLSAINGTAAAAVVLVTSGISNHVLVNFFVSAFIP